MQLQEHRPKKRLLGYFVTQSNGVKLYMALKSHAELERGESKSLGDALRSGEAGWALDASTLVKARSFGAKYVVIKIRQARTYYVALLEDFMNPGKSKLRSRGKRSERLLPATAFVRAAMEIKL